MGKVTGGASGSEDVLLLDLGAGYMDVVICESLSAYPLRAWALSLVYSTSRKY